MSRFAATISLQPSSSVLSQRYKKLFASEKFTDCIFTIDRKTIRCHKLILAAASPVFEAMFYGAMPEENLIEILDISAEVFTLLVKYIYIGEIDVKTEDIQNLIELYYAAEKYILCDLVIFCLNAIKSKLRFGNILPALDLSMQMGLKPLIQVCSMFFSKCCLTNPQYTKALNNYYYHITKDCIKSIIASNKESKFLPTFVMEWCKIECKMQKCNENEEYSKILDDLDEPEIKEIIENQNVTEVPKKIMKKCYFTVCNYAERTYYKASRPFLISSRCFEFTTNIKSSWYIQILGVIINSRLIPKTASFENSICDQEYCESIAVEILCNTELIHRQKFFEDKANYNCYLDIPFDTGVIISPDEEYQIKFIWNENGYGAEYPLGLHSNRARAITFTEDRDDGSLLKGIKYLDLI